MKNYVQHGDAVYVKAPSGGVKSGAMLIVGSMFGVVAADAAEGETVALWTGRIWSLAKDTAVSWAQGDAVYWDDSNHVATTATSGNTKVGIAADDAAATDAAADIRLNGSF